MRIIPPGWQYCELGDCANVNPKTTRPSDDCLVDFFTMADISAEGFVLGRTTKQLSEVATGFTSFAEKDVLVAKITPCFENGKGALINKLINIIGFGSTEFHVLRATQNILPEYLLLLTQMHHFRATGAVNMTGSAGQKRVPAEFIKYYPVYLPPLRQQKKIVATINLWDLKIERIKQLIAAKQERRQWLMQQLLTGKRRLPGFTKSWNTVLLGEVFTNRVETDCPNLPLVSITGENGVVSRDNLSRRDSSSEDKSLYLRICPGDIGYNTMRMWQGVCGLSKIEGIVSPAYTIATPKETIDGEFMALFFKSSPIVHLFHRHSQGLVSDTLNLKWRHFAEIKVFIPEKKEQKAIAKVFRIVDREIELLRTKLSELQKQKKGLMQQLLTGKRRVKV